MTHNNLIFIYNTVALQHIQQHIWHNILFNLVKHQNKLDFERFILKPIVLIIFYIITLWLIYNQFYF